MSYRSGIDVNNICRSTTIDGINNYSFCKIIGKGTFGEVNLSIHIPTKEKVAIKVLERSKIQNQIDITRVYREISILMNMKHRNIIQLYQVVETSNKIFLIMEYSDYGELFSFISIHKYLSEKLACVIFHQIISGIEELHRHLIIHRDLKPENILLKGFRNGDFIVKIVDFGLSNILNHQDQLLSTACGSPCYAAPEMVQGKKYIGTCVDIWSIGITLFAMICGYLPFEDQNIQHLYLKIIHGKFIPAKWLSLHAKDLLFKILDVNPLRRLKIHEIKKHSWYQLYQESDKSHVALTSEKEVEFHNKVVEILGRKGFDISQLNFQLENNIKSDITTGYYLYKAKLRKQYEYNIENIKPFKVEIPNKQITNSIDFNDNGIQFSINSSLNNEKSLFFKDFSSPYKSFKSNLDHIEEIQYKAQRSLEILNQINSSKNIISSNLKKQSIKTSNCGNFTTPTKSISINETIIESDTLDDFMKSPCKELDNPTTSISIIPTKPEKNNISKRPQIQGKRYVEKNNIPLMLGISKAKAQTYVISTPTCQTIKAPSAPSILPSNRLFKRSGRNFTLLSLDNTNDSISLLYYDNIQTTPIAK